MPSIWSAPETVAGFVASPPNPALMRFAELERSQRRHAVAIDVGCGAGRNAVPLARGGWIVLGTDTSRAMLDAAAQRRREADLHRRVYLAQATMARLPACDASADLLIAHGIWNLARSSAELRSAVREAARVVRPGGSLFVFTFSRTTLPPSARPVPGETFVFTDFAGDPQCFLTGPQLVDELATAGFEPDSGVELHELNRPSGSRLHRSSGPVIWEGTFRRSWKPAAGSR